jgi:hypothetical protein
MLLNATLLAWFGPSHDAVTLPASSNTATACLAIIIDATEVSNSCHKTDETTTP